jgi:hypothetical protein
MRMRLGVPMLALAAVCLASSGRSTTRTIVSQPHGVLRGSVHYSGPAEGVIDLVGPPGFGASVAVRGLCQFLSDDGWLVDIAVTDGGLATIRIVYLTTYREVELSIPRFSSPCLSPRGDYLAFVSGDSVAILELATGGIQRFAGSMPYAVGWDGQIAMAGGRHVTMLTTKAGERSEHILPTPVVGLAWERTGRLFAACRKQIFELSPNGIEVSLLAVTPSEQVTWLGTRSGSPTCLIRRIGGSVNRTTVFRWHENSWHKEEVRDTDPHHDMRVGRGFMWPLLPNETPPIGNSYGEYQYYGGTAYRHPGIDLMGYHYQPVYAVADGFVKAVLTTSGEWHWRVAVADASVPERCRGWLYAHLDLSSIAVSVGDTVETGDYLGSLVPWPVADFTHLHFARIEHEGEIWDGQWLCPGNPHLMMDHVAENDPPFFLEANGALVAFCQDNTSAYHSPDSLFGAVDIVAHVGDRILSDWVVCAQEIRYHIYPCGRPEFPVVDDKLAVYFDHSIDVYQGGMLDELLVPILFKHDSVCPTAGDYSTREFYHILTNSDGDIIPELTDEEESFNTALLPDGAYVVRLRALDVAGNTAEDSMDVILANGNPDLELHIQAVGNDLLLCWPRMVGATGYLIHRLLKPYSLTGGAFVTAVTDTFYLIDEALISGSSGFYRVVATDIDWSSDDSPSIYEPARQPNPTTAPAGKRGAW